MKPVDPKHLRVVRLGHGANCSSIGSVLDLLFATAAIGSAVFVAAAAAVSARDERTASEGETRESESNEPPPPDPVP